MEGCWEARTGGGGQADTQGGSSLLAREEGAILKAGIPLAFPGVFVCAVGGSLLREMSLENSG